MINSRALSIATVIGTLLQLAMVLIGHSNPAVASMFAVGGMTISLIAGVVYAAVTGDRTAKSLAAGGALAGGICALIGIVVSFFFGDVPALILVLGSLSSAVTGAVGGLAGRLFAPPSRVSF